jgi:pimeloyl-ACP methyl ester carboxylesterase
MNVQARTAALAAAAAFALSGWNAQAAPDLSGAKFRDILGGTQKIASDHGVDEAKAVMIGGVAQWITVRGRDRRNPILLVLHGGPAAPELPTRYLFEAPWTDYFTVVEWDQRGAGKTYALNDPAKIASTLTEDRMVADAEELVAYLRTTYGKKKIFALGHSWGSILGLRLAQDKPQWLYAYIGMGQIIDMRAGERAGYAFVLKSAEADHNEKALAELKAIAPYPEADGSLPIDKIDTERKWSVHYGGLSHGHDSYDYLSDAQRLSPDYADSDVEALVDASSGFSFPKLLPQMARTDFTGVKTLDCPIIIFAGRYDYTTPTAPVERWYDALKAPRKRWVWFENSAHMMSTEEPGKVLVHLVEDARPLARAAGDVAPAEREKSSGG